MLPNDPNKISCVHVRAKILMQAAIDILKKCDEGMYVKNVLEVTAEWDGVECDKLMDENREPAQTKFTAGWQRNLAKEIEYRLSEHSR